MLLFFFNDTATTEIYTLSLHDALPISYTGPLTVTDDPSVFKSALGALYASGGWDCPELSMSGTLQALNAADDAVDLFLFTRSEEHTSELQSRQYLVCRLLLEKKQKLVNISHPENTRRRMSTNANDIGCSPNDQFVCASIS